MNNSYNGTTKPQNHTSIPGFSLYMDHVGVAVFLFLANTRAIFPVCCIAEENKSIEY